VNTKAKLESAAAESSLHQEILSAALSELAPCRPFDAARVTAMEARVRQQLDQVAYRFMKLQDTLGERVLPGLLILAEEPLPESATFQQKLQRLERLGAVPSAETWRTLRELRNPLAHEYPDAPAIQAALIEALLDGSAQLIEAGDAAKAFLTALSSRP
jgi:hypothetical protein